MKPRFIFLLAHLRPLAFITVLLWVGALGMGCVDTGLSPTANDVAADSQTDDTDVFFEDALEFDFYFNDEETDTDNPDSTFDVELTEDIAPEYVTDAGQCETEVTRQPYLQRVTQTSIRVFWETSTPASTFVEYGLTEELGRYTYADGVTEIHRLTLQNLLPGTIYYYRIKSCKVTGDIYSFSTAPEADTPFRFAVYGDSQENFNIHAQTVAQIIAVEPDLVLHVGDTVTSGGDLPQYNEQFFGPAQNLLSTAPIYISIGNHEAESLYFYDSFSFGPDNSRFSFAYGNAFFLAFDSDRPYWKGSVQYNWLKDELSSSAAQTAKFRVVFFHKPPYCEGWTDYEGEEDQRRNIVPLFEQYDVDAVFNGHVHDYERGHLNGVTYFITGGGAGGLDGWVRDVEHIVFYQATHHFINVEVSADAMSFSAIDLNGTVFDTYEIIH